MKILMRHQQTQGLFRSVRFKLWGKIELEGDEQKIINRYDFDVMTYPEHGIKMR